GAKKSAFSSFPLRVPRVALVVLTSPPVQIVLQKQRLNVAVPLILLVRGATIGRLVARIDTVCPCERGAIDFSLAEQGRQPQLRASLVAQHPFDLEAWLVLLGPTFFPNVVLIAPAQRL